MKHIHAELIKAWADGAEIEVLGITAGEWYPVAGAPKWFVDASYRIKPERVYPKSSLTPSEAFDVWMSARGKGLTHGEEIKLVADAAVKRYIQENESK
jgi:hypothetical protein